MHGYRMEGGVHLGPLRVSLILWALCGLLQRVGGYTAPPEIYRVLDARDNIYGKQCDSTVNGTYRLTQSIGNISDGCNPRYMANMFCHWYIAPSAGSITLEMTFFALETGYDFINITDGKGTLLGVFTGNTLPPKITSSTGIFDVRFVTDGTSHMRGFGYNSSFTGFKAKYYPTPCPNSCSGHGTCQAAKTSTSEVGTGNRCQCEDSWWGADCNWNRCMGTTITSGIEGSIMDWQRGINDWNTLNRTSYNLQDCRWVITPSVIESSLTLKFWSLDLEKGRDFLWVYDGDSWNAPLLAQISSNNEWSNNSLGLRQVPMIRSTSGKLFLHYTSDKLSFRTGFYAQFSTLQRCSEYCKFGTCVGEQCVCQEGRYGGDCSSRFCTGSTYLYNRTGAITDHAGISNYQGFADCRWYLRPSVPINFITFRFTHFVLEGGLDFLYVHDGLNETAPLTMSTYIFNHTIDTAMTGDGLHRVQPLVGAVEPYVYDQHVMMMGKATSAFLHFKTDMNDNNITIKYPGLLDTSTYGIGQRIGFRMEYEGVFCAGITHIYQGVGTLDDGSREHNYHGGQRCIWVLHPPTCQIAGRERALPRPYKECAAGNLTNIKERVLELVFDVDIHESDTLRVLDGDHVGADLLQSFHNNTGRRISVTSAHHTVLLEFITDGTHHAQGFNVSWQPVPKAMIARGGTVAPYPKAQQVDGDVTNRPPGLGTSTICSGTTWLYNLTNTFQDHVLPSITYRNNMVCQWNIQTPAYTQQLEWWLDRLDLPPGRLFHGVNTSGFSQLNARQVGFANHTDTDHITLYKGRQTLESYETVLEDAFAANDSRALAKWTGYMQPVARTPAAVPIPPVPMMTINGSRAFAIFRTSAHYVDLGFQLRYQAVFSDPQLCEVWGRGWGASKGPWTNDRHGGGAIVEAEGEVHKAVQITLRTARYIYPHMRDWRVGGDRWQLGKNGTVGNWTEAALVPKWHMTQGGAKFVVRLSTTIVTNSTTGSTRTDIVDGNFVDLWTGHYMISFLPKWMGISKVEILMHGPKGRLEHINGSPYNIRIRTGPTDPKGCRVIGNLGEGQIVLPESIIMFRIQAGDFYTNKKDHGGDQFIVKLDGPHPVAGVIKDMYDGTYNASFSVDKAGKYDVFVGISYLEKYETAILGSPFTITVPKIKCPGGGTCSGHGTCKDNGDCVCEGAYDSSDCSVDLIQPYRDAIVIENVILGVFIFIYGVYTALSGGPKDRGDGMLGELDDEDDEEVQFQGLKCCMHW